MHGLTTQYDTPQEEAASKRVEQDSQTDTSANRPSHQEAAGPDNRNRESQEDNREPVKYGSPYSALSPAQRRRLKEKGKNRTLTRKEHDQLEWDRLFNNRRKRGVDRFCSDEKQRLLNGESETRNWTEDQINSILHDEKPRYNGEVMQGHHMYNAIDYPQLADDPTNIYPVTRGEHFQRWHGGNYQNETHGVPNNFDFEEEF